MLAHKIRGLEEEQASMFPLDVISEIVRRWQSRNQDKLEDNHDYLTEFLDKLSLVRHPKGRALVNAFVAAKRLPPPKQTRVYHATFNYLRVFAANYNVEQEQIHSFSLDDQQQR